MKTINLQIKQPKLWILDIDGVIFTHNSYLEGKDKIVPGFIDFYRQIKKEDYMIIISARKKKYIDITKSSLKKNHIRFNNIIFEVPTGERVIINDKKPDGTKTCFVFNINRNNFPEIKIQNQFL